jgi:insulysin
VTKHISQNGHVWRKFGSGNRESLLKAAKDLKARGRLNDIGAASRSNSLPPSSVPSRMPSPAPSLAPSLASNSSESEDDGGSVGRETRRRLVEWWSREYCAGRMRLCIIGKGTHAYVCLTIYLISA